VFSTSDQGLSVPVTGCGVLSLRTSAVLPAVRAAETSPPRHPSAASRHGSHLLTLLLALTMMLFADVSVLRAGGLTPLGEVPVPATNPQTPEKVELGRTLFFDRRLSGDGTMSCASCHNPEQGFADGQAISLSYPTTRNWRNAQTLVNVAYQKSLFHDGRSASLEEQALFPLMSAFEMNQNLDFVEEELRAVPEYLEMFARAFGSPDITRERIGMALAAFERTLVSREAPLDRFLAGDEGALTPAAREGYAIFTGKGRCSGCHAGGNLADDSFHALNVPESPEFERDPRVATTRRFVAKVSGYEDYRRLAEDPGRFLVTKEKRDWKAFRTPTLREISLTAPYMHNGIFATLEEVIAFVDRGGGEGNPSLQPLRLTEGERQALRTFLIEALTGPAIEAGFPHVP
jgi:cytochrome c peroxidase